LRARLVLESEGRMVEEGAGLVFSFVSRGPLTVIEVYHLVSRLVSNIVDGPFRAMPVSTSPYPTLYLALGVESECFGCKR
jgi:hypothetical protein